MKKFLAPEVVQSSAMDCGPAALKCLLEGFGIHASYGRLREACQTGIDGTSIDTMESVANQLGLEAEQIMLPLDHLVLSGSNTLPAIVVVRLPSGVTHFVVGWRLHGRRLQVMDPAAGRRWTRCAQFAREVFVHTATVAANDWREYAVSEEFQAALRQRLRSAGICASEADGICAEALADSGWRALASLDAGVRLLTALERAEAGSGWRAPRNSRASRRYRRLLKRICANPDLIPQRFWSVHIAADHEQDTEQLLMRGAVLVRIRGKRPVAAVSEPLLPELTAAIQDRRANPGRELLHGLRASGGLKAAAWLSALGIAAGGVVVEAVLFRGLFDIGSELGLAAQRAAAMAAVVLFSLVLLSLEVPLLAGALRFGRQIETRLRVAFLAKIPKLGDRYFRSRLTSDMAERSHVTHRLRHLPELSRQFLRAIFSVCATGIGIVWLEPSAAPFVVLAAATAIAPAFLVQSLLIERDLRVRSHVGALTRFYLDAMLGMVPIRTHGAERSLRREYEKLLSEWGKAAVRLQRAAASIEGLQLAATFGLVIALLLLHSLRGNETGRVLLIVYWALNIPVFGQQITALARQYPNYRNTTLRLVEPLGAPEESSLEADDSSLPIDPTRSGWVPHAACIEFRSVSVDSVGHKVLEDIDVRIPAGTHVAIVGASGAGKSSLVGVLLGWLKPSQGSVAVDGAPLDCDRLRLETAWVDPAVQLWNRSFLANLCYGSAADPVSAWRAIDAALLRGVLENLPRGFETELGEGGALVSGGEGQRVRLGRAMLRKNVRLVILDEPFRGLDREKRRQLLVRARELWQGSTILCITHDIRETQDFDRVLLMEHGRIAEDGTPFALSGSRDSRYGRLLEAEDQTRAGLWSASMWRRIRIHSGRIVEEMPDLAREDAGEIEAVR